jgi:excinuclease ABC subunit B
VIVGINLLREGLDLPEVSLVAILDADKEGILRSDKTLIQIMGRAARHVSGLAIMYGDTITASMQRAIDETNRRRNLQLAYNAEHGIQPESIRKAIRDLLVTEVAEEAPLYLSGDELPREHLNEVLEELQRDMKLAARELRFEEAAKLRDRLQSLQGEDGPPTKTYAKQHSRRRKRR